MLAKELFDQFIYFCFLFGINFSIWSSIISLIVNDYNFPEDIYFVN